METWGRVIEKKNGRWVLVTDDGIETTIGYSVESVVLQYRNEHGLTNRIYIRDGEIGLWKNIKKIEYETSPLRGALWAVIHI